LESELTETEATELDVDSSQVQPPVLGRGRGQFPLHPRGQGSPVGRERG